MKNEIYVRRFLGEVWKFYFQDRVLDETQNVYVMNGPDEPSCKNLRSKIQCFFP